LRDTPALRNDKLGRVWKLAMPCRRFPAAA
jgi:hypothetical protein